jgi:hypothetical protein
MSMSEKERARASFVYTLGLFVYVAMLCFLPWWVSFLSFLVVLFLVAWIAIWGVMGS